MVEAGPEQGVREAAAAALVADFGAPALLRMLDHLPGLVAWWGPDLRIRYANAPYQRWFGVSAEALQGMHMQDLLGAEDFARSERYVEGVLAGEPQSYDRILADARGRKRSTMTRYVPASDNPAAGPDGFYVLVSDISNRTRAERALEESVRQMALLEERQRIAADLHDMVIQRLFAAGLDLSAVRRGTADPDGRISSAAVGVDEAIRELRRAIHSLREVSTPKQVPATIERILANVSRVLGFVPTMTYSGSLEGVPEILLQDLLAVVNEALSNVARHAGASQVALTLSSTDGELLLRITDDGRGLGATTRSSGLSNMRGRAERHGGTFTASENQPKGTVLEWRVPLAGAAAVTGRPPGEEVGRAAGRPSPRAGERAGSGSVTGHSLPRSPLAEGPEIGEPELCHLLDRIPAVVAAWDGQGRNLYANRQHLDLYGWSPEELRGVSFQHLMTTQVFDATGHVHAALAGEPQHFERSMFDAGGTKRHVQVFYIPNVVDGRPDGFYVMITDISDRVRAEQALEGSTRQMTLLEERQRIAANLHDMVIQRLFAAGLDLVSAQRRKPDAEERIAAAASKIDESISELREAIHSLRELMAPRQLPASIEAIIGRVAQTLGFVPTVTYTGSLDVVPQPVMDDLVAVANEALTNTARHAEASAVSVTFACSPEHVLLQVADDGHGLSESEGRTGLATMRLRAERHGGTFLVRQNHPSGTVVEWLIPLGQSEAEPG